MTTTNSGAVATDNEPCAHFGRFPGDSEYCDWQECAALSPAPAAAVRAGKHAGAKLAQARPSDKARDQ